jgi:hypothetical protein
MTGNLNITSVRFAQDASSNTYIFIGTTSSVWQDQTQISIPIVTQSNSTDAMTGWASNFLTSESGYFIDFTANLDIQMNGNSIDGANNVSANAVSVNGTTVYIQATPYVHKSAVVLIASTPTTINYLGY